MLPEKDNVRREQINMDIYKLCQLQRKGEQRQKLA